MLNVRQKWAEVAVGESKEWVWGIPEAAEATLKAAHAKVIALAASKEVELAKAVEAQIKASNAGTPYVAQWRILYLNTDFEKLCKEIFDGWNDGVPTVAGFYIPVNTLEAAQNDFHRLTFEAYLKSQGMSLHYKFHEKAFPTGIIQAHQAVMGVEFY